MFGLNIQIFDNQIKKQNDKLNVEMMIKQERNIKVQIFWN